MMLSPSDILSATAGCMPCHEATAVGFICASAHGGHTPTNQTRAPAIGLLGSGVDVLVRVGKAPGRWVWKHFTSLPQWADTASCL